MNGTRTQEPADAAQAAEALGPAENVVLSAVDPMGFAAALGRADTNLLRNPQDPYVLNAVEDHIAPWKTGYQTPKVLSNANARFVLSSAGHIAGIVNPPGPPCTGSSPATPA